MLLETYNDIRALKGTEMFATATKTVGFHWLDSLGHVLVSFGAAFKGAQSANRLYREYARLSDSQLAARGLRREDIGRLALRALDRSLDA